MKISPSLAVASVLTLASLLCFVLASPLVPMASQLPWIWIGLAVGLAATFAWASTLKALAEQDQETFHP
jgi:ABC-type multidrug transport system permease subunit